MSFLSERYKLGLSRDRLFSPEACVCAFGTYSSPQNLSDLQKALKKLSVREPLLTAAIELKPDGRAYFVTDSASPSFSEGSGELTSFAESERAKPFDVTKELFRFILIDKVTVGIFAHEAAADCKGLAHLLGELNRYLLHGETDVTPATVRTVPGFDELPRYASSPITAKLVDSYNDKWAGVDKKFTLAELPELYASYGRSHGADKREIQLSVLDKAKTAAMKAEAQKLKVDYSSLLAFSFYTQLKDAHQKEPDKKKRKLITYFSYGVDLRRKLATPAPFSLGNFSSYICSQVRYSKKAPEANGGVTGFHKAVFKSYYDAYSLFNVKTVMMGVDPFLADSQFFYAYSGLKNSPSKNLSKSFGVSKNVMLAFNSYNLDLDVWNKLSDFESILLLPPFPPEAGAAVSVTVFGGQTRITAEYAK